ncbi:CNNM domain-containing protein [Parenemella sanctibonifatiensis]|uniref:CNNM transmembrane domain-containing protein n=1 Tax=Parenemella sanctibonifatiensis TaxID=2016505 RepID=A0A255EKF5_9ACTN|nr:hemolysin family protein [Parenemella sanctibonifatiensis]OYN85240.1 hypothetical protein CGZ92_10540 [Parenemella sanctibonifatiensis]OYN92029.1 hypothetical protein CGZ91_00410 [Parenemella sanctibonifatiensis]
MNGWVVTLVTIGLIILSAFFVIIEFALLGARRHRLEERAADDGASRAALRSMNELTVMLAAAQLGITVCTFALGAVTKPALDGWLGPVLTSVGLPAWLAGGAAFVVSLLVVTFLHLVVGEMAPKSWAIAHPETAARVVSPIARAYVWPLRPFLEWVNRIANRLVRRSGVEPVERAAVGGRDADTIRHLVEYSSQVGVLEPELQHHLTDALELSRLTIADVTDPGEPTTVAADATVAQVHEASRNSGHRRILQFDADGTRSSVIHVRDTLLADAAEPASDYARSAYRVSWDTPAHEVLTQMREHSIQLVLVDHPDGVGVATLTDIVQRVLPGGAAVTS